MTNYKARGDDATALLPAGPRAVGSYIARAVALLVLTFFTASVLIFQQTPTSNPVLEAVAASVVTKEFWLAASVGLFAQLVDGALGMTYGVTSTSFLLAMGVPSNTASASVHLPKSRPRRFRLFSLEVGNVNKRLFQHLVVPGMVGGLIGAYMVSFLDGHTLRPWISGYLLLMGFYILFKAFRRVSVRTRTPAYVVPLALGGGFVDAVGGGGWGPVVTTTLLGSGHEPRRTIGSVNAAEFFVAVATGFSFAVFTTITAWTTIGGLVSRRFMRGPGRKCGYAPRTDEAVDDTRRCVDRRIEPVQSIRSVGVRTRVTTVHSVVALSPRPGWVASDGWPRWCNSRQCPESLRTTGGSLRPYRTPHR